MAGKKPKEYDVLARAVNGNEEVKIASSGKTSAYELHTSSKNDPKLKKLQKILLAWINSYVAQEVGTIMDLDNDLADGQILGVFLSRITGTSLDIYPAISENSQKHNLNRIFQLAAKMGINSNNRWTVEGIMNKDYTSLYYILIEFAHAFNCPKQLPSDVSIAVTHTEFIGATKKSKTNIFKITGDESQFAANKTGEETLGHFTSMMSLNDQMTPAHVVEDNNAVDLVNILFTPEKSEQLTQACQLLCAFINKNISGLGVEVTDLAQQMNDGVFLVLLIGSLGNFFVPLSKYHFQPMTADEKLDNVMFAFKLLETMGIQDHKWNAIDIVRKDLKMIIRVLLNVFQAFNGSISIPKLKQDMNEQEIRDLEAEELETGPLSLLTMAVKNHTEVLISCRNNRKLLAHVKAFDRHCNMVLENVKEMWTEIPKASKGKQAKPVKKNRFISKLFLRGDSVILVLRGADS